MSDFERVAQLAFDAWSIELRESGRELHGPCPFCPGGRDRFIVWPEGNYWCRVCESTGYVPGVQAGPLSRETVSAAKAEKRSKQLAHLSEWQKGWLDRDAGADGHRLLMRSPELQAYLLGEGITGESIERYQLGYVPSRTFQGEDGMTFVSPAYTFPHFSPDTLMPVNVQYRILDLPEGNGGKYRQELGLPPAAFFTLPKVLSGAAVVVEGAKKAIVLSQLVDRRLQVIGWPGMTPPEDLMAGLECFDLIWLILDPGPGREKAEERSRDYLGDRIRTVSLAVKPDDAVVRYGLTRSLFRDYLSQAR